MASEFICGLLNGSRLTTWRCRVNTRWRQRQNQYETMAVRRQESICIKADSEVTKLNKVQREYSIQSMAHSVRDSVGRWQVMAKWSPLLTILSIPHNLNTSENLSILNLLDPLILSIILLYSAHPPPLLLKYLIVHTTEPLLSSEIIYQNLWELSLTRHLMLHH